MPPSLDQGSPEGLGGRHHISQALEMEAGGLGYSPTDPHYLCQRLGCWGLSWSSSLKLSLSAGSGRVEVVSPVGVEVSVAVSGGSGGGPWSTFRACPGVLREAQLPARFATEAACPGQT